MRFIPAGRRKTVARKTERVQQSFWLGNVKTEIVDVRAMISNVAYIVMGVVQRRSPFENTVTHFERNDGARTVKLSAWKCPN